MECDEGAALPTRAEQQEILLGLLAATPIGDGAALDLGIGSGLFAEAVLGHLPDACRLLGGNARARTSTACSLRVALVGPGGLTAIVDRVRIAESLYRDRRVIWRRVDSQGPDTYTETRRGAGRRRLGRNIVNPV